MTTKLRRQPDAFANRNVFTRPIRVMRRVRRRHRWVLRVLLALPVGGLIGGVVLTRTAVTRWLMLPRAGAALNMKVSAQSVYIGLDGKLVLEHASFRLPDMEGPAGEFLKVARIEAGVDWLASIGGTPKLKGVRLIEPVVLVSQSLEDRSLNLGNLSLPASSGAMALPAVTATNAGLTLAEHSSGRLTVLKHVQMEGWLVPAKDNPDGYTFQLVETTPQRRRAGGGDTPGFKLRGTLGTGALEATIENFQLDQWPDTSIPTPVRALFNQMNLEGEVPRARVDYTPEQGLRAELELKDVGMDLPIEPSELTSRPEGEEPVQVLMGPPPPQVRLHGLTGAITFARDQVIAKVRGKVENLPYQIHLRYDGTSADAPFICEFVSNDFRVDRNPRLLPYAPQVVKERLRTFSSPTAIVNTRMMVRRGRPVNGEAGPISISGQMEMRDGVAAFEDFPYEFRDMSGLFRFDTDSLDLVRITGRSESGAELTAHGRIAPLTDDAQVDIAVDVRNAPIDDAMEAAFGGAKGEMVPALFNRERYEELRAAGLVQTEAEAQEAAAELERLRQRSAAGDPDPNLPAVIAAAEERAAIPVFEFRGSADVSVRVHRPLGDEVPWSVGVEVRLAKAGLLPEKFPLPIEARDVLVRVENRDGKLVGGTFRGLTGGEANVTATFNVPFADDADQRPRPQITIDAADVPMDSLLIHALPGPNARTGEGSALKRILHGLGISGRGAGRVRISPRDDGELGFDADFAVEGGELRPGGGDVAVGDVSGRLRATEDRVDVEIAGQARAQVAADSWAVASGPLSAAISAVIPPKDSDEKVAYQADLRLNDVELGASLEEILAVFSPAAAKQIADLRREHRPEGQVNLAAQVWARGEEDPRVSVEGRGSRPVSFDAGGGRVLFRPQNGLVRIESASPVRIGFEDLQGAMEFEGSRVGEVSLGGGMLLARPKAGDEADAGHVSVAVRDGLLESTVVGRLFNERIGGEVSETWNKLTPRGLFDADLTLERGEGGDVEVRGGVRPRTLTVKAGEEDVSFSAVRGSVDFGPGMGSIRALALETPDWSATTSATWNVGEGEEVFTQAELAVRGQKLTPELRELLPPEVGDVLRQINLAVDGPFQLKNGELDMIRGSRRSTAFSGVLEVDGAALDVGAVIEKLTGSASIRFQREAGKPADFEVTANAEHFETGGIVMGEGSALVKSSGRDGEILIPHATAQSHGGRVVAQATVMPGENGMKERKAFTASVRLSGLRFAPLLKDLQTKLDLPVEPEIDDRSRGVLEGSFALQGLVGKPESRRGRGSFQIAGGRILNIPFMMRMIELSNLQLPTNAKLGYARGNFFLDGGRITFEDLGLYSSAVQILGSGSMTWPEKVLDLRFDTKPARGIPILSGLLRGIRDELVTTSVQGTLSEPDIKLKQFPGARRMLGRTPGTGRDEPPVGSHTRGGEEDEAPVHEGVRPSRAPAGQAKRWDPAS